MTPHERCLAAIAGEPVDRPPRYIPAMACSVASELLGRPVSTGAGSLHYAETCALMQGEQAHDEFVAKLFEDLAELHRMFDIDVFRQPWRQTSKPTLQPDENTFIFGDPDGDHSVWKYAPESGDFGPVAGFRKTPIDPQEAMTRMVDQGERQDAESSGPVELSEGNRWLHDTYGREFFVPYSGGGIVLGISAEAMLLVADAPDLMARKVMLQARRAAATGEALAASPYPSVMLAGGDMAGNDGPMYSPASFRHIMLPALKHAMIALNAAGVHYVFRSDGNLWSVADMLFKEAACPGYGEVDRDVGMTTGRLRQRYPELVIWNNFSSEKLVAKSAAWVRDEARRCIDESGGTGYFHGASNAILMGTPPANVEAMFSV